MLMSAEVLRTLLDLASTSITYFSIFKLFKTVRQLQASNSEIVLKKCSKVFLVVLLGMQSAGLIFGFVTLWLPINVKFFVMGYVIIISCFVDLSL